MRNTAKRVFRPVAFDRAIASFLEDKINSFLCFIVNEMHQQLPGAYTETAV